MKITLYEHSKKVYQTTDYGNQILKAEVLRMTHCIQLFESNNRGEKNEKKI